MKNWPIFGRKWPISDWFLAQGGSNDISYDVFSISVIKNCIYNKEKIINKTYSVVKTVQIKHICCYLNMYDWFVKIEECLRFQNIWCYVNFSFLAVKGDENSYFFAVKSLSIETMKIYKKSQWDEFVEWFKNQSKHSILTKLLASDEENLFAKSRWRPLKLVCAYL